MSVPQADDESEGTPPASIGGGPLCYQIKDVAELTGISAYTLRYYDKCGFFPNLQRDENRKRWFTQDDIGQLRLVDALRKSGLSIEGIQYFVRLMAGGSATQKECAAIIESRTTVLEYRRDEIDAELAVLEAYQTKMS